MCHSRMLLRFGYVRKGKKTEQLGMLWYLRPFSIDVFFEGLGARSIHLCSFFDARMNGVDTKIYIELKL